MIDPTPPGTPSHRRPGGAPWLAAALSGLLLAASFPPFDFGYLAWVALVPLLWSLSDADPRQAVGRGYLAGFLFMAGIGYFTTSFGGEVLWMRILPWALFTALEALWFIPLSLALAAILRRGNVAVILAGVPAVWALSEWARGAGSLGFPFGYLGYALHGQPSAFQTAAFGGIHLVSALVALASTGVYIVFFGDRRARRLAYAGLSLVVVSVFYGLTVIHNDVERRNLATPSADVALAQGNTQYQWSEPAGMTAYEALAEETLATVGRAQAAVDLVVWSESSVPGYLLSDNALRGRAARVARSVRAPLLTGTIGQTPDGRPTNLSVLFGPEGEPTGTYQKRRLVPFGEWVPLRNTLPLLESFGVVEEDEVPGDRWNVLEAGRLRLGTPICFESAAPWISRAFVRGGANLLVVITNDAWFFRTGMAEQHAHVSQFRAVETGRWVVRCGLTGISGFITPRGRWQAQLPLDEAGGMVGSVRLEISTTPYVRFGDWFLYLCLILAVWALFGHRFRHGNA